MNNSSSTKTINSDLKSAIQLHQSDKIEAAIEAYTKLLKSDETPDVQHLLAIAYAQINQMDSSLKHGKAAVQSDTSNPQYLSTLGNIYRRLNRLSDAESCLNKALALEPKLVAAQHNLGIVLYQKDDISAAIRCFDSILENIPNHAEAHYNLGLCYIRLSQIQNAKKSLECAAQFAPRHPKALYQLAQIYHEEEAHRQACLLYERHLQNHPQHADALQKLGVTYLQLKRDEEGLAKLEQALKFNDSLVDIHHNLASVYLHRRQYQLALKHWLLQLKTAHDIDTLYNIGVTYSYLGRYEEATDYLFSVLKENPKHYESLVNLGAVYLQTNRRDLACNYYHKAQAIRESPAISFVLKAIAGEKDISSSPPEYVQDLFDQYASHYDEHLQNVLQYRVPEAIAKMVKVCINPKPQSLYCVDLGCGTGLCAPALSPYCHKLVGIDMAQNMLDKAKGKRLYHALYHADVLSKLADITQVDLAISGDLLPYFGALDALFSAVSSSLRSQAYWVFSIEKTDIQPYCLGESARFSHSYAYILAMCSEYGLKVCAYENTQLRTQQQSFVDGYLFCVQKF